MALLSRLFSYRKNQQPQNSINIGKNESSNSKTFTFSKDQIRVLLFRECDWRGRKLLFDSNAVQKVSLENSACKLRFSSRQKTDPSKKDGFVEVTNGYGYQYTKPSSDATLLAEMMFGAVAMTFRGTALKVHSLTRPDRLMCTKVFPSPEVVHPNRRTSDKSLEDSFGSSINSMSDYFSRSESEQLLESVALDVDGVSSSVAGDSGFCGDFSLQSVSSTGSNYWAPTSLASPDSSHSYGSLQGGSKQSGGSLSSLQRRWLRNVSTSLELGPNEEVVSCGAHHHLRRTKLGLTVLITLTEGQTREMEMFLFERMSIVETMMERLRHSVERAYLRKDMFVHLMYDGWSDMRQSMYDMMCMPRHACPMWLNLGLRTVQSKDRANLAAVFVHDLCQLIATLDTKATNFFVSTLVTGVLTHHLGWVNTVLTANNTPTSTAVKSENDISLNELSKSHPYNPLWAQLGDLYGALGSPTKVAKTIITSNSRKTDCVNKLLTVVTYFIRCGEVKEATNLVCDEINSLATLTAVSCENKRPETRGELTDRSTQLDTTNNSSSATLNEWNVINTAQTKTENTLSKSLSFRRQNTKIQTETVDNSHCFKVKQPNNLPQDVETCRIRATNSNTSRISISCLAAENPKPINSKKTDNLEAVLPSFISYLDDKSTMRLPSPPNSSSDEVNDDTLCVVEMHKPMVTNRAGFYLDGEQKSLNETLEILSCGTEKRLRSHDLKDGNFCSPAGAEWEHEEYRDSLTRSDSRVLLSCEDVNLKQEENSCKSAFLQYDDLPGIIGEVSQINLPVLEQNRYCFKNSKETLERLEGNWSDGCNVVEKNAASLRGLQRMKRTSSCRTKLSDLSDKSIGLYPNIDELAKMENMHLSGSCQRDSRSSDVVDGLSSEEISKKITKLCRVPTSSILFHLEPKDEDLEFNVRTTECLHSKRSEVERQTTTFDKPKSCRLKNLPVKSCLEIVDCGGENEVLFVLGDNEQLKDITHRSTSSLVPENGLSSLESDMKIKCSSDNNLKVNLSSSQIGLDVKSSYALANEVKVVTVKASYIDMEVESGLLKTEFNGESYLKPFERKHKSDGLNVITPNLISRSCSINLPLPACGKSIEKIKTKVFRRHTDVFCDKCKTLLREKHANKLFRPKESESCDANKAFLSCEKCYYRNQKYIPEGLGNFHRTKSEMLGLNLMDVSVSSPDSNNVDSECDYTRCEATCEKPSALFEQSSSSDDELLGSRCLKRASKAAELRFENLHVVELPLPSCLARHLSVVGLAGSLLGGVSDRYVPDLVLQGCSLLPIGWETALKRDLALVAKLPLLGQDVSEAVCIVANTNTWEVQLVSSHAYVVDKPGTFGVRVGMSQLVANMLESLVHLHRLKVSPEQCLLHLENKLKELFLRSQALAELLLTTEFCNMSLLTSSLDLEANDVPLLLAIASTHSPHIANRYGLSFM